MATKFDNVILPSNSTDALFRAWCTFIHDLFVTTGGWTNTADTGQINLVTVASPNPATNTKAGYKIYAMADALQATAPIFVRVDFGTGAAALTPAIWVTIGTGSNGSGTITGIRYDGSASGDKIGSNANNAAAAHNSYGSAGTNRVVAMMFVHATARFMFFSIERSKDANGADTNHGILLTVVNDNTMVNMSRYIVYAGGTQPPKEDGLHYILSGNNPSAFGSDVGIAVPIHIGGVAKMPGTQVVITRILDFVAETSFAMTVYGAARTYQLASIGNATLAPSAVQQTTTRFGIRYD